MLKTITSQIDAQARDPALTFPERARRLAAILPFNSVAELVEHVDVAGVIPEAFRHDSTEEKLFAKYCDHLLARALVHLGLDATTIPERSDAADVIAEGSDYRLVGDAKAFRLSRTAKNQKDFKVESLDQWRKGATFAVLVCPWFQYPSSASQIYLQAARLNVTLLSYTHLSFLLRNPPRSPGHLKALWQAARSSDATKSAEAYWSRIERVLLHATDRFPGDLLAAKRRDAERLPEIAREQVGFWNSERSRLEQLPHAEAIRELLAATRIDSRIGVIQSAVESALERSSIEQSE